MDEFLEVFQFTFIGILDMIQDSARVLQKVLFCACMVALDGFWHWEEVKLVRAWRGNNGRD